MGEKAPQPTKGNEKQRLIRGKMLAIVNAVITKGKTEEYTDIVADHAKYLKRKYPNYLECELYHALVGSTIPKDFKITQEDFPGEDSIEAFVETLEAKYLK